jgi:hypothetical protein
MVILCPEGEAPTDDPRPIRKEHYMKLVEQARTEGNVRMEAALLLCLNCAMYDRSTSEGVCWLSVRQS